MITRWTHYPGDEHFSKFAIGTYGRDSLVCALEYCKHRRTFLDIGAHIGHFTWNALTRFKRVIAFEPVLLNVSCLKQNVDNKLAKMKRKPKVAVFHAAVGDVSINKADMWFNDPSNGNNSGAWELSLTNNGGRQAKVDLVAIDSMRLDDLDLMKIDTQGWEERVLDGAKETIQRCKPVLILEVVNLQSFNRPLTEKAIAMGYHIRAMVQKNLILVRGASA